MSGTRDVMTQMTKASYSLLSSPLFSGLEAQDSKSKCFNKDRNHMVF